MADVFTHMAARMRPHADAVTTNGNTRIIDHEQIFWTRVYDLFEANYRENMCSEVKITTKRKIHIDNCEADLSSVHEPQMKWCPILFLDGIVQIAMNKPFTSKQQSCNDRRQFNQHSILQNCIESIAGILSMNTVPSLISAFDEQQVSGISSSSSYPTTVTGYSTLSAAIDGSVAGSLVAMSRGRDVQSNVHTLRDSDDEEKPIIHDEKPIGNYSKMLYKNPNRRGDSWSYRSWLSCWGSFEMLTKCLESFAGIGKSAAKHQLTGQTLLNHLQSIPAVHVDARVSMEELMRPASFSEIFVYVRLVQTQMDKKEVSVRTSKRDGPSTRRTTKVQEKIPKKPSNPHNSSNSSGGGTKHVQYENLDETASEGEDSDHDDEMQIAVKRSRATHASEDQLGNSLFKSMESCDEGNNFVGKKRNGVSKRQKPLPSGSGSDSRVRMNGMSSSFSSLQAPFPSSSAGVHGHMNMDHHSNNNPNHHHNTYHQHHYNNNPCALANGADPATLSEPTYNYNNNIYVHPSSTEGSMMANSYENSHLDLDSNWTFI